MIVQERNCQKKRISPPTTDAIIVFFKNNVRFKEDLGTRLSFKIRNIFEKFCIIRKKIFLKLAQNKIGKPYDLPL